ncbi:MAG: hypothetical protein PUH70_08270, partial [Clostridiales bacterium]|nr:hypothetical protein [Clostridiales bacterium]MDY5514427.1 hypothetical protein [Candidatus Ventricola sp.]
TGSHRGTGQHAPPPHYGQAQVRLYDFIVYLTGSGSRLPLLSVEHIPDLLFWQRDFHHLVGNATGIMPVLIQNEKAASGS